MKGFIKKSLTQIKQSLRKTVPIREFVKKRSSTLGKGVVQYWYYLAVVIILFMVTIPFLPNQNQSLPMFNQGNQAAEKQQADLPPTGDLFSQQQANKIVSEEVLAPTTQVEPSSNLASPDKAETQVKEEAEVEKQLSLTWPIKGEIVYDYGFGYSKAYADYRFNPGINIAGNAKEKIMAAASGKVIEVGEDPVCNKYVVLEHEDDYTTFYANLDSVNVEQGDKVESGTVLGILGEPGYHSLGLPANLYFQVKWQQEVLDPNEFLK